jgi:uncharacterized protein (DUF924 family)
MAVTPQDIVDFWREAGPGRWFAKDDAFDAEICVRFFEAHEEAARGELSAWLDAPESALALLLLLDQFPRNLYRGSAHAFATDPLSLSVAREALRRGHDAHCGVPMKQFFYMPFMHSENLGDQQLCVALCRAHGLADNLAFAEDHRDIIARFGRFPHRNKVMGRATNREEQAFLDAGGFAG